MSYNPEKYQANKQALYENQKRWLAKQGDEFRLKQNKLVLKAVHKYYENNRDKVLDYKKNYYQTVIKPRKEAAKALLQLAEQTVEESPIPEKIEV